MRVAGNSQIAFYRGMDSRFALLTPWQKHRLAELPCDSTLEERVAILAEKATEGELTKGERAEYEGYIEAGDFLAILQSEARVRVCDPHGDQNG